MPNEILEAQDELSAQNSPAGSGGNAPFNPAMKQKNIIASLLCSCLLCGCSLDYENTGAMTPEGIWQNEQMINAFLSDIYGNMTPGWPISANNTDEGMDSPASMSQYVRGEATVMNSGVELKY